MGLPWWCQRWRACLPVQERQEMWVQSLGQEDALEKGMATYSVFLPGESMDRGAWWATVHSVAKSQAGLKWLSTHACTLAPHRVKPFFGVWWTSLRSILSNFWAHSIMLFTSVTMLYIRSYAYKQKFLPVRDSLVAQMVKNLPAIQEMWVWSLDREDALEKEMATHSSTVAWRIPWMEELVLGVAKSRTRLSDLHLQVFFFTDVGYRSLSWLKPITAYSWRVGSLFWRTFYMKTAPWNPSLSTE